MLVEKGLGVFGRVARAAIDTRPRSLLVAPVSYRYRCATMATHWAGVVRPGGWFQAKLAVWAFGTARRPWALAEPVPRPLVDRPIAHHHVGHAGRDGHCRLPDRGAPALAAVVDAGEEFELSHAKAADDLHLGVVVRAEGADAVDLRRLDPGIAQGQVPGLHRQPDLTTPRLLGELRCAVPAMAVLPT